MGLAEFRQEIDQLAKLKMNVFQFYWGMGGPWVEFSYAGKVPDLSIYDKASRYGTITWCGGTAELGDGRPGVLSARRLPRPAGVRQSPDARAGFQHRPRVPPRNHSLRPPAQSPGVAGDGRDAFRAAEYDTALTKRMMTFYCGTAIPTATPPCWISTRPPCEA